VHIGAVSIVFCQETCVFTFFSGLYFLHGLLYRFVLFRVAIRIIQNARCADVLIRLQLNFKGIGQEKPSHPTIHYIRLLVIAQGDKDAINALVNARIRICPAIHFEGVNAHFEGKFALYLACGNIIISGAGAQDSGHSTFAAAKVASDGDFYHGAQK